jgi:hypothetical protein
MGRKNYQVVVFIFLTSLLAACVKDKPIQHSTPVSADTSGNVLIVCEGSLGNGNSSLGLYQSESGNVVEDIYEQVNSQPLGDVFQSIQPIGDRLFLCINNSDKIVVINRNDYKLVGTIAVPKPRYILPVSESKAYVSSLFSNKVYIINPATLQLSGSMGMPALNTEGMLLHKGSAYFCCWDTANNKLFRINPETDKIEQEITLAGRAPQEAVVDKFDMLWVLSGNVAKKKRAALTRIDPSNGQILTSYQFPEKADPIRPVMNNEGDMLYFIEVNYDGGAERNGIYRMNIKDVSLPEQAFISAKQFQYYWALSMEPGTDRLYIGDPKGFVQKGMVYIYNTNGDKQEEFSVGVGPGHFYFDQ